MPRLPPVLMSPHARLLARLRPGVMRSVVTLLQSHSSSSATSCARPVSVPWPISARTMRITVVSSGLITTHAFISVSAAAAAEALIPNGRLSPSARPPPAAAELIRNLRRETSMRLSVVVLFMVVVLRSRLRVGGCCTAGRVTRHRCTGRNMHGRAYALVRAAAADVGHRLVDVLVGRLRHFSAAALRLP